MIKLEKNLELDLAIKNIINSMVEMDNYLTSILNYNNTVLTGKKEKELIKILKKHNIPYRNLKCDWRELTENPYYKNIKLHNVSSDNIQYEENVIKKRTLISMDFNKPLGKYLFHYHPLGFFEKDVIIPTLREGDKVWMSPSISEFRSMQDGIDAGHGKCLTMGLGLGVLPYLWLLKDNVESVTIVECNKNVINLFEKYIKPQFPTNKEIEIINGDAFEYFNEDFLKKFDYVYVDFWESPEDGLKDYTKLMEKKISLSHINYWIEDSILYEVKCVMAPYLYTLYENKNILDFISSLDEDSKIIGKKINRYFKSKNDTIKTEDELLTLLHSKEILKNILSVKL